MSRERDRILDAAIASRLNAEPGEPAPERLRTIAFHIDHLIGLAVRWSEQDLARCLYVLDLARRQRNGLSVCQAALEHAAARLNLELIPPPATDPDGEPTPVILPVSGPHFFG